MTSRRVASYSTPSDERIARHREWGFQTLATSSTVETGLFESDGSTETSLRISLGSEGSGSPRASLICFSRCSGPAEGRI